jgi:hypothetical protein
MTSKRLEATAYHEAGHAIAAWRLDARVFRVTIEPDEDSLGATHHSNPMKKADFEGIEWGFTSARAQRRAENSMLISLAGTAAQRRHNPRGVRVPHGKSDREQVYEILSRLCGPSPEMFRAYYRLMDLQARAFVRTPVNWQAIEILANELLRVRTLSGKSLRAFIISDCFALKNKKPLQDGV